VRSERKRGGEVAMKRSRDVTVSSMILHASVAVLRNVASVAQLTLKHESCSNDFNLPTRTIQKSRCA
jgi:hypothetical protein